jgi:hypothetical protein
LIIEGLHTERDSACQERADAHWQIDRLLSEVGRERELKIEAEDMIARLATEVSQC